MPGIVFTPSLLSVLCNRLSSVEVALWTAFFFLQEVYYIFKLMTGSGD